VNLWGPEETLLFATLTQVAGRRLQISSLLTNATTGPISLEAKRLEVLNQFGTFEALQLEPPYSWKIQTRPTHQTSEWLLERAR
jgi:hypothetical protein